MNWRQWMCWSALAGLALGCHKQAPPATSQEAPVVTVSQPIVRKIVDFIDYTGRTEAVNAVDVRARVTGYLVKMPFKEGDEVHKDDLLFEIDPRPYQAQLDQAESMVNLYKAQLKLAEANYARAKVISRTPGAISQQDIDQYKAAEAEAQAQVEASQASLEIYQLNRDFCEVTSPIDGKVSRYYYTLGNLVTQDQTLLTTIVSLDPMYVYFDIDERTVLRIRREINEGKLPFHKQPEEIQVLMGLQGETGFPHEGHVNFINNTVDPFTGTITLRGVYENPRPPAGIRLLSPGMFVRVRIPLGVPHDAVLINERAVGSDQGLKYVFVIGTDKKVEYRRVTLGALQDDGFRVVDDGLKPGELVVVSGLQQVRANMVVSPEEVPMPSPTAPPVTKQQTAPAGGPTHGGNKNDGPAKPSVHPAENNPGVTPPAGDSGATTEGAAGQGSPSKEAR